jgi:chaperone required for assembly of F1-ATPase
MTGWSPRRFWTEARAAEAPGGFTVTLDGRPLRTPAKAPLLLPTRALAGAIAAEWQAVEGEVRPAALPLSRIAHTAIDRVAAHRGEVAAELARYGGSDLLCYRAAGPAALAARQAAGWDPLLAWAAAELGAPLAVTAGIVHVPQPPASLAALAGAVAPLSPMDLAALHDLVVIPGSLVLGLAVARGRLAAPAAFALSRIDEDWQAELWGQDAEAAETAALKARDHAAAARFWELCRSQD